MAGRAMVMAEVRCSGKRYNAAAAALSHDNVMSARSPMLCGMLRQRRVRQLCTSGSPPPDTRHKCLPMPSVTFGIRQRRWQGVQAR